MLSVNVRSCCHTAVLGQCNIYGDSTIGEIFVIYLRPMALHLPLLIAWSSYRATVMLLRVSSWIDRSHACVGGRGGANGRSRIVFNRGSRGRSVLNSLISGVLPLNDRRFLQYCEATHNDRSVLKPVAHSFTPCSNATMRWPC